MLAEGDAVPADTSRPLLTLDTIPLALAQSEESVDTIKGEELTPLASALSPSPPLAKGAALGAESNFYLASRQGAPSVKTPILTSAATQVQPTTLAGAQAGSTPVPAAPDPVASQPVLPANASQAQYTTPPSNQARPSEVKYEPSVRSNVGERAALTGARSEATPNTPTPPASGQTQPPVGIAPLNPALATVQGDPGKGDSQGLPLLTGAGPTALASGESSAGVLRELPSAPLPKAAQALSVELVQQVRALGDSPARAGFELRLDPPELGMLRVFLSQADGQLTVLINADRADTDTLMRRHAESLLQTLKENGFASVSLNFQDAAERAAQTQPWNSTDNGTEPEDPSLEPAPQALRGPVLGLGFDRRV